MQAKPLYSFLLCLGLCYNLCTNLNAHEEGEEEFELIASPVASVAANIFAFDSDEEVEVHQVCTTSPRIGKYSNGHHGEESESEDGSNAGENDPLLAQPHKNTFILREGKPKNTSCFSALWWCIESCLNKIF